MSQPAQGWHPNPQLMQQQAAPQIPPAGWSGSWPPVGGIPPGYPGPPPMPHGAPPRWNAGYWQYNPQMRNAQQPWAPSVGWGVPANFNPYKRVPRPPSPSYWQTQLTDNGLGLEGMVKKERKDDPDDDEPHTPWIWNPPSLLPDTVDRATPERTFDLRRGRSQDSNTHSTTPTRESANHIERRPPARDGPSGQSYDHPTANNTPVRPSTTSQVHNQTPDRGTPIRGDYIYRSRSTSQEPQSRTSSTPLRHATDPSYASSSHRRSASTGPLSHSSLGRGDSFSHGRSQQPTASQSTRANGHVAQGPIYTQEPESYTTRGDLQPTFSSTIVRTPTHYQPRRSTDERRHASVSPSRHGSTSQGRGGAPPLARHSSMPTTSSTHDSFQNFTEDLSNSLPSLSSGSARSSRNSVPLSRTRTEPTVGANLTTIPETSSGLSSGDQYFAPLPDPPSTDDESLDEPSRGSRRSPYSNGPSPRDGRSPHSARRSAEPSPRDARPSPYTRRSPDVSPHALDPRLSSSSYSTGSDPSPRHHDSRRSPYSNRPSPRTPDDPSSQHRDSRPSPYSSSSTNRRENPLPPPPVERPSLAASQPPVQEPPPTNWSRRVRLGLWNRRGDHLTTNMYVVYAPEDRAYPPELRDYPNEREGYSDQHGTFIPWSRDRPELPASLPNRGRPPAQPYDSFVVYKYFT
ncbi:hypothetical protein V8B97DRAFT_840089 [Scleroderma yunnanense]